MIERTEYLNKLIKFKDKKMIKVITGVRRCGKSTLLKQYKSYLINNNISNDQIISINFEDLKYDSLRDYKELYNYIIQKIEKEQKYYIILDEIQNVNEFQRTIDSLFLNDNLDIYITGSNSYMLSSEIATLLSGRYVLIEMLPLSFKEFVSISNSELSLREIYNEYLTTSSFPYATKISDDHMVLRDYLDGLYSTIVINDIMGRKKINDSLMLKSILKFVFSNIGNVLSSKKIADAMTSAGRKIDVRTVESYVSSLMESYIVYEAKRYNIKNQDYLKTLNKYYVVDIGLRYMLLGNRNMDYGHMLENIIYLELIRRGYDVYVGKIDNLEVDFVCQGVNGEEYYQVALTTVDNDTLARELKSLNAIKNNYPKYLLTLDEEPDISYDGIIKKNALRWLLDK